MKTKNVLDWWRIAGAKWSRLIDRVVRSTLFLFALALLVLGASALSAALFGYSPSWPLGIRVDSDLLGSLGSVMLGFAGLYIGAKLRKYQELEAQARANLALNVDLRTRVVPAGDKRILEMVIEVHNVSRSTWIVPMAYLFVHPVFGVKKEIPLGGDGHNVAHYPATLPQLQPDERDQFFATAIFSAEEAAELSAVKVSAEVVGAPSRWLGPEKAMLDFVDFMDANDKVRHGYFCIARCTSKGEDWYGKRCFVQRDGKVDVVATEKYRGLLDDMMLWNRERVISLSETVVLKPEV